MERREFIITGVGAGLALGTNPAAAAVPDLVSVPPPAPLDFPMEAWFERLDKGLNAIRGAGPAIKVASGAPVPEEVLLNREAISTLMVVGSIKELPKPQQSSPLVAQLLEREAGAMLAGVAGMVQRLENLSPAQVRHLQASLKSNPDHVMELGQQLDDAASALGISNKRRLHLRAVLSQVAWRISHQSADLIIHEAISKVQRDAARADLDTFLRESPATLRQLKVVRLDEPTPNLSNETPAAGPSAPAPTTLSPVETPTDPELAMRLKDLGRRTMAAGGAVAAVDLVLCLGLTLAVGAEFILLGLVGLTAVAVLVVAGLLVYATGSLMVKE